MNGTQIPHYHIIESDYGDPLDRPIRSYDAAWRALAHHVSLFEGHKEGGKQEGAYRFYDKDREFWGTEHWDMMVSIYTCTGEQPCPCEEK